MIAIFGAYVVSWTLLIGSEYHQPLKKHHLLLKSLTSFLFLVMTGFQVYTYQGIRNLPFTLFLSLGMCGCFLGDVCLSVKSENKKFPWFLCGAGAFMAAHGMFFVAMNAVVAFSFVDALLIVLVTAGIYGLSFLQCIDATGKRPLIFCYALFLGLLLSKAVSIFITFGAIPFSMTVLIGAVFFAASDIILLFQMFSTVDKRRLPFFNLLLYYTATMLLAVSVGLF